MIPIRAGFQRLAKIINLRLRVDDLDYVGQGLYHNLAIVRPAVVDLVGFLHLPCRGGKCSAALRQILVDVDLLGAVVIA